MQYAASYLDCVPDEDQPPVDADFLVQELRQAVELRIRNSPTALARVVADVAFDIDPLIARHYIDGDACALGSAIIRAINKELREQAEKAIRDQCNSWDSDRLSNWQCTADTVELPR